MPKESRSHKYTLEVSLDGSTWVFVKSIMNDPQILWNYWKEFWMIYDENILVRVRRGGQSLSDILEEGAS